MDKKSILIFGVGDLQKSIIDRAKALGLYVVGIDPCAEAFCRDEVDAFEVVGGQDYEGTLAVARKYKVAAVVTAATDKPLEMMARVAEELHLKFYSVETAKISTDKFLMKQCFERDGIPCAKGRLIHDADEARDFVCPVIVKPRDNSGSRGVVLCKNNEELRQAISDAFEFSKKDTVLVEEFIEGREYSIEGLHFDGRSEVIQFTEKTTTPFPYNVELAHKQPAQLTEPQREEIRDLVRRIAKSLRFENCGSHTELKINDRGIFIIETSPRLGGDNITSHLVPLSTGINIEEQLLRIAMGLKVCLVPQQEPRVAGVRFLTLPEGVVEHISSKLEEVATWPGVVSFHCKLREGDCVRKFKSGLDRYGELILAAPTREVLDKRLEEYSKRINEYITIKQQGERCRIS